MLRRLLINVVVYSIVLYLAAMYVPMLGFSVTSDKYHILPLFVILGAGFWIAHLVVTRIVEFLSFPLYILTLGLFSLVVNVGFFYLFSYGVASLSHGDITVTLGTLFQTFLLSLFVAIVSLLLKKIL